MVPVIRLLVWPVGFVVDGDHDQALAAEPGFSGPAPGMRAGRADGSDPWRVAYASRGRQSTRKVDGAGDVGLKPADGIAAAEAGAWPPLSNIEI